MGSPELYIQPILAESLQELDASMSVMPGVSESLETMAAQLNQTTRIMMNLLENQGLEQHQAPYTGASFSALTTAFSNPFAYMNGDLTSLTCYSKNAVTAATDEYIEFAATGSKIGIAYFLAETMDLVENVTKITFPFVPSATLNSSSTAYLKFSDGTSATVTPTLSEGIVTIENPTPTKLITYISFEFGIQTDGTNGRCYAGTLHIENDGDTTTVLLPIRYFRKIGFNSVNALTHLPKTQADVTCQISSREFPQFAFITIPDENNVSKWSTAVLNGNIEGLTLSIADDTSKDFLIALSAATSDISDLQQFTNLALRVDFTTLSALSTLTGFTLRYF